MDYQRACGCRMGRPYAPSVYRTMQMNNTHLQDRQMQESARTENRRMNERTDCCGDSYQHSPSLAIVTSPSQVWQMLFTPCDAMAHGTLFCELHKPWLGCNTGGRTR